jgi:hypothetical protein
MPSPEASRRNLQKARARWQAPERSEGIKDLVWEWHISTAPKESGRALARRLGVSHTYVRKLVRKLPGEPPWPRVPIQEKETPFADAPPEELENEQSVSPIHKPRLDVESDWGEEAREYRLREYGEFIARRRPRVRRWFPGRPRFMP